MNFQDLVNNIKATAGYAGATIATATDTDSAVIIDTQGFESVAFAVYVGAITDGQYVLKIMETDNSDGTTGAAEVASYQNVAADRTFTKTPTVFASGGNCRTIARTSWGETRRRLGARTKPR